MVARSGRRENGSSKAELEFLEVEEHDIEANKISENEGKT